MAEIFHGQRHERHRQQHDQCQSAADPKHQRQDDQHAEEGLLAVHDRRADYLADRA